MASGRLVFDGDVEMIDALPTDEGYWFEAVEGISFGQPVPVEAILTSLLRDGSLVSKTGDDNREVAIPFRVCGSDPLALAAGEARIGRAIGTRTTLEWTPPDDIGPTTVFDVMSSDLDNPPMDDLAELRNRRTYTLRLTCLPFGRSVDKIVDDADTAPMTGGVVQDNCESTSGWSTPTYSAAYGPAPAAPAVDSTDFVEGAGSIKLDGSIYSTATDPYDGTVTFERFDVNKTGLSVAVGSSGGYVSVAIKPDYPGSPNVPNNMFDWTITYAVAGKQMVTPIPSESLGGGWVRYVFQGIASDTITDISFIYDVYALGAQPKGFLRIDDIELLPSATTDKQILKSFTVEGSARAPGSIHISAPASSVALGKVLAITVPASEVPPGFQPDVRRWVTSGTTTPDATALHGSYFDNMGGTFDVPVSMLTAGPHTVVALVRSGTNPITIGVNAQLYSGSLVGPVSVGSVSIPNAVTGWQLVAIGTVYLPPLPMMNADVNAKVRITFTGAAFLADAYMIPEAADFSIVDCGTGTVSPTGASSHLWIDSPSPSQPQGGWWRGPAADRLNSRSAWPDAKKPGLHVFEPGTMLGFLVSTGAQGPRLELEYFPRWRTNAAL